MNLENVSMGVCDVTLDDVSVGHTNGGVTVTYTQETEDVVVDKYGKTPADKMFTGERIAVKVPLAEDTIESLGIGIPTGTIEAGQVTKKLKVGSSAGKKLSQFAKELILHPIALNDNDHTRDLTIYRAVVTEMGDLEYKVDSQRVIEVTFEGLIDEDKTEGNYLFHFGVDVVS